MYMKLIYFLIKVLDNPKHKKYNCVKGRGL
nr:MAG TPA: hypothetical protein [Caudoviricetes sp.]